MTELSIITDKHERLPLSGRGFKYFQEERLTLEDFLPKNPTSPYFSQTLGLLAIFTEREQNTQGYMLFRARLYDFRPMGRGETVLSRAELLDKKGNPASEPMAMTLGYDTWWLPTNSASGGLLVSQLGLHRREHSTNHGYYVADRAIWPKL